MLLQKINHYFPVVQIVRELSLLNLIYLLATISLVNCQQRVVPGINPQHYQQVPGQQQQFQHPQQPVQYQQQQQQQQVPQQQQQHQQQQQRLPPGTPPQQYQQQQYQQVPVQQQHQQQPQQQQAPHGQGHHDHHGQPQQVLNAGNIQEERAHIQEHMQVPIDTSKMSEAELQFHYFKMHDSDNNNKLDGCELIKSLIHWHEQSSNNQQHNNNPNEQKPHAEEKVFSDEELVALIDPILKMDDTSSDGFIDYPEFIRAQQKANAQQQQQQQQNQP